MRFHFHESFRHYDIDVYTDHLTVASKLRAGVKVHRSIPEGITHDELRFFVGSTVEFCFWTFTGEGLTFRAYVKQALSLRIARGVSALLRLNSPCLCILYDTEGEFSSDVIALDPVDWQLLGYDFRYEP